MVSPRVGSLVLVGRDQFSSKWAALNEHSNILISCSTALFSALTQLWRRDSICSVVTQLGPCPGAGVVLLRLSSIGAVRLPILLYLQSTQPQVF